VVLRDLEWLFVARMKNGEIARSNVNLTDRLPVYRYLEPLGTRKLLVAVPAIAVEPASFVPVEVRPVTFVEDAPELPMRCSSNDVVSKERVQLLHLLFERVGSRSSLEVHGCAGFLPTSNTS
jgi:hypothetical protein